MSEQILLLNPRRRKRRVNRRRHRARNRRRRSNRRRMPAALARYWASKRGSNPRRRRRNRRRVHHRRRAMNPRRRHHRRYNRRRFRRSNPRFNLGSLTSGSMGRVVTPALIGAAGGVALDVTWGYLTTKTTLIPASLQAGYVGLAAKLGVVFGGAWVANKFLFKSPKARLMTSRAVMGATTVLAYGALKGALQSMVPAGTTIPGLSGYMDYQSYALPGTRMSGYMARTATLGSLADLYSPAAVIQPPGTAVPRQFGSYVAAQPGGLSAYQPHTMGGLGGIMGYDWTNDGM